MAQDSSSRTRIEPLTPCIECEIRELALFRPVEQTLLDWKQRYRQGQYSIPPKTQIYTEGQVLDEAYTLFRGWVALTKTLPTGKRQVLRIALPGDFLGYQPNQFERPSTHSAVALTECVVCLFPRSSVETMVFEQPDLAKRLIQIYQGYMAYCQEHITSIGQRSAKQRIAELFLDLLYRLRRRAQVQGNRMPLYLTQEDIGDAVGITSVHVSRVMRQLREAGLIRYKGHSLTLLDEAELARVAGVNPERMAGARPD
jgi:CRP/FNR family transcriptional regulator